MAAILKSRNQRDGVYLGFCGKHVRSKMRKGDWQHDPKTEWARDALERRRVQKESYAKP